MIEKHFTVEGRTLVCRLGAERVWIDALGTASIRVRATQNAALDHGLPSGLLDDLPDTAPPEIKLSATQACLTHGPLTLTATLTQRHLGPTIDLSFADTETGRAFLQEEMPHVLYPNARDHVAVGGDLWKIQTTFAAHEGERFFGLGQHQTGLFDQKGAVIELMQKNTEVAVPLLVSSRGYGVMWNAPGTGRVELGRNLTRWVLDGAPQLDYVVLGGGDPAGVLREYGQISGRPPPMPDWATGFWQCKLRYSTQAEVLEVAREYARRGLGLSCLIIDFFNWSKAGEWRFDDAAFPDPKAMIDELTELGIRAMVSVWPTVNSNASTFEDMRDRGLLVRHSRGAQAGTVFVDANTDGVVPLSFYDTTNPEAQEYHWARVREGYVAHGVSSFWLDANEPEIFPALPDGLRFHAGEGRAVFNAYPQMQHRGYARAMAADGITDGVLLSRSAWLGSQRYPVVVWSGDVHSTFDAFARQIKAGLNMAMSGVPWWTTDIGGFFGGDIRDAGFRELLVRWFQYGAFSPIFRMHGFRCDSEGDPRLGHDFLFGGAGNEVWSFGPEVEAILTRYLHLRERLRPYIQAQMGTAHKTGLPPMRPMFLDHPDDAVAWTAEDQYKFGPDLVVAPVVTQGARQRDVFAPSGSGWIDPATGQEIAGGDWVTLDAPLERMPVLARAGASELLAALQDGGPVN